MATPTTRFCCAITSLTRIAYGSLVRRHGRSRPCARYHSSSRSSTALSLEDDQAAGSSWISGSSGLMRRTGSTRRLGSGSRRLPNTRPTATVV